MQTIKGFSPAFALAACAALTGCVVPGRILPDLNSPASLAPVTPARRDLIYIPPPGQPIPVAVYGFVDQTGQLQPSENFQSLSRAVTQGGTSILINALREAGNGRWFSVLERERLDNLLKERQIIREMRARYLGETETPTSVLPSLLFAGLILEGGIIGFDSNTQTGGVGAAFLGIGGHTQYRQSTVTVFLRAVSVRSGEVLANVITQKTVASIAVTGNAFRFVTFDELLEAEVGTTTNEPTLFAVEAAIEKAVYALIMEGAQPGPRRMWSFADSAAGDAWLQAYASERQRALAAAFSRGSGSTVPGTTPPRRRRQPRQEHPQVPATPAQPPQQN